MPSFLRLVAGIAIVAIAAVGLLAYLGRGPAVGGPPASTTPTDSPRPSSSIDPRAFGTDDWVPFESSVYGFTMAHPADWPEIPATRTWTLADDAVLEPLSIAMDSFSNPAGSVRVSMWEVSGESVGEIGPVDDLMAWAEAFCRATGNTPCDGVARRAYPMCLEYRDCHPATMVVYESDVQAYFSLDGATVGIVVVWRPDRDPSTAAYGSSKELLQRFVSTVNGGGNAGVWPEGYLPGGVPVLVTQRPS